MSNPLMIEKSREGKRRAVEKLYGYLTLHEPMVTSEGDLAERFRVPKQDLRNVRMDLIEIGSLKHVREVRGGKLGVVSSWTLIEPLNVTKARLEARWKRDDAITAERLRQPHKPHKPRAPKATDLGTATPEHPIVPDVLVASAGPEPSKPMAPLSGARYDEPRAMIEAARQYHETNKQLDAKIKELEGLGMQVDRAQLAKAIKAPHDHQLLVVSKVLPYVEELERANARLTQQNTDLREKASRTADLEHANGRLSEQNRRLVSELQAFRVNGGAKTTEPAPKAPAPSA